MSGSVLTVVQAQTTLEVKLNGAGTQQVLELHSGLLGKGDDGNDGNDGASAYQVAVANGFVGSEVEWLASLNGTDGNDGDDGAPGLSAYQVAIANGFVGTEVEWLASLHGTDGADGGDSAAVTRTVAATGYYLTADTLTFGAGSIAMQANNINLYPVSWKASIDALVFEVTTAGAAGSQAVVGIYDADPVTGRPTTLLHQSAPIAISALGLKIFALPADLAVDSPKWLAIYPGGSGAQFRAGSNMSTGSGIFGLLGLTSNPPTCLKQNVGAFSGVLPPDFSAAYPAAIPSYEGFQVAARVA